MAREPDDPRQDSVAKAAGRESKASYESYASAQQYRAAESIDVKFEPPQKEQDDTSPS